ncbi:hypothetical protein BG61_40805 [Caballeronia glathei]|uniref:Uncharacterized protein n=1 Tax=Caballeronia glathei TaxID=60547 RepID=A0A069PF22_9BURK|nr:hypothetical protein BG61_40805 [Caballeronia glathei]
MSIRRCYDELSHAMWSVDRRLQNDGAPADKFVVKRIGVLDIEIAKIAVVAHCRRRHCIWAMPHHDAHTTSRNELPAGAFWPFKAKAERVTKV